ncbi:MAG: DUF748 domain-containing protein [Candidatus Omnitrophica bacterium]|nr:DUF748 domain-containing protein [Candidatus Omnitrophota bacterium]
MKRNIILLFLVLCLLSIAAFFYVNKVFLAGKIKGIIEKQISIAIDRPVEIGKLQFQIPKGLGADNIRIYQKDSPKELFVSADNVSLTILVPAIFLNKQIIISSISIVNPTLYIKKTAPGEWNFSDILEKSNQKSSPKTRSPFSVLVRKISIQNGKIQLTDETKETVWQESFENIDLLAVLSILDKISYTFKVNIPSQQASFESKGIYDLLQKSLTALSAFHNITLVEYLSLADIHLPMNFKSGILSSSGINLALKRNRLRLQGNLSSNETDLQISDHQKLKGNIKADPLFLNIDHGRIDAKGLVLADAADISISDETNLQGNLMLDIQELISAKNNLLVKGNFSLENSQSQTSSRIQLRKDIIINGPVSISNLVFVLKNKNLNARADILAKPVSVILNANTNASGELSAQIQSLKISDATKTISLQVNLALAHALIDTSAGQKLQGNITANNITLLAQNQDVQLSGNLRIDNALLKLNETQGLKGNLSTVNTNASFKNNKLDLQTDFELKNTVIALNKDSTFQGDISSSNTTLALGLGAMTLRTNTAIHNALLVTGKQKFEGNPQLNLVYQSDASGKAQYSGTISLVNASASGLPKIAAINAINGDFIFDNNHIETKRLTFNTHNISVESFGSVENFNDPFVDMTLKTSAIALEEVSKIFPEYTKKIGCDVQGIATVKAHFKGLAKTSGHAETHVLSQINHVAINSPKLPSRISNVSGQLEYTNNLLIWKNLQGEFLGKHYTFTGQIANFSRPVVISTIASTDLRVSTQINILHKAFQICKLKGSYLNSTFDIMGDVHLFDNSEPDLDLRGTLAVNLMDLRAILPEPFRKQIYEFKPLGTITLNDFLFQGKPKDWRNWNLTFKGTSPEVSLLGHTFHDFTINLVERDQNISNFNIASTIYDGTLNITSSVDLTEDNLPMKLSAAVQKLDLAVLQKKIKTPVPSLAGIFAFNLDANGPLLEQRKIKGTASMDISDGNFGQIIPQLRNTIFNAAHADFVISNAKFTTENAVIKSNAIDLKAKGWVDFAKNVNFDITPRYAQVPAVEAPLVNIDTRTLIEQSFVVKVTGTLDKMSYKVQPLPVKILENTTGAVKDVIKSGINILEGLF